MHHPPSAPLPGATGVPPAIPLPAAPLPRSARPNPSPLGLASGAAFSWRPELEVSVFSLDPALDVSLSPHDWSSAVVRPTTLTLFSARCTGSLTAAVSLPIAPPTLKVRSFQFPQLGGWRKKDVPPSPVGPAPAALPSRETTGTRFPSCRPWQGCRLCRRA